MRTHSATIFLLSLLLLFSNISAMGQVTDKEVADLALRIGTAEKVEQLYSVRYAVGKYAARTDLTIRQQQLLMNTMKLLSDEFKMRSHFRNAADVYKDYLDYNNKYLITYNTFAKDSLTAVYKNIATTELSTIASLDAEIGGLSKTRAAVSGLKKQYYSFGSFGAIAVVVLTLIIVFSRNRAINQAQAQINENRERLKLLHKTTMTAGMNKGIIAFCRETASLNSQIINTIIESVNQPEEKKVFQKEINVLHQTASRFNHIASES